VRAQLYLRLGQFDAAKEDLKNAESLLNRENDADLPELINVYVAWGAYFHQQGSFAQAEVKLLGAYKLAQNRAGEHHIWTASIGKELGKVYLAQGNKDRMAESQFENSDKELKQQSPTHPYRIDTLAALGALCLKDNALDQAKLHYEAALDIAGKRFGDIHPDLAQSLTGLAIVDAARKDSQAALGKFEEARRNFRAINRTLLPSMSDFEQLAFLEKGGGARCEQATFRMTDRQSLHQALSLGLAAKPGDKELVEKSAEWLINGKAVTLQAMAERELMKRDTRDPAIQKLATELAEVRNRIAALDSLGQTAAGAPSEQLERLAEMEAALSKKLAEKAYRPAGYAAWVGLEEVRKALTDDEVLIDIVRLSVYDIEKLAWSKEEQYVAWIINGKKTDIVALGAANEIDQAVASVRAQIENDVVKAVDGSLRDEDEAKLQQKLKPLSGLVVTKLYDQIKEYKRWIVSPDGELGQISWAALLLPVTTDPYVVTKHSVRYVNEYDPKADAKLRLIAIASNVVSKLGDPTTPEGRAQLFKRKYPLRWGKPKRARSR